MIHTSLATVNVISIPKLGAKGGASVWTIIPTALRGKNWFH